MRDDVFEYRSIRTKEAARRGVRELLICFVLAVSLIYFTEFYSHPAEYRYFEETFILAVILGVPVSMIGWAIYRVLRFAFSK